MISEVTIYLLERRSNAWHLSIFQIHLVILKKPKKRILSMCNSPAFHLRQKFPLLFFLALSACPAVSMFDMECTARLLLCVRIFPLTTFTQSSTRQRTAVPLTVSSTGSSSHSHIVYPLLRDLHSIISRYLRDRCCTKPISKRWDAIRASTCTSRQENTTTTATRTKFFTRTMMVIPRQQREASRLSTTLSIPSTVTASRHDPLTLTFNSALTRPARFPGDDVLKEANTRKRSRVWFRG